MQFLNNCRCLKDFEHCTVLTFHKCKPYFPARMHTYFSWRIIYYCFILGFFQTDLLRNNQFGARPNFVDNIADYKFQNVVEH